MIFNNTNTESKILFVGQSSKIKWEIIKIFIKYCYIQINNMNLDKREKKH